MTSCSRRTPTGTRRSRTESTPSPSSHPWEGQLRESGTRSTNWKPRWTDGSTDALHGAPRKPSTNSFTSSGRQNAVRGGNPVVVTIPNTPPMVSIAVSRPSITAPATRPVRRASLTNRRSREPPTTRTSTNSSRQWQRPFWNGTNAVAQRCYSWKSPMRRAHGSKPSSRCSFSHTEGNSISSKTSCSATCGSRTSGSGTPKR